MDNFRVSERHTSRFIPQTLRDRHKGNTLIRVLPLLTPADYCKCDIIGVNMSTVLALFEKYRLVNT